MSTPAVTSLTPEVAKTAAELFLNSLEHEREATRNVIGAVTAPAFRLDSKARSARELAWHIVAVEVGFLNEIANKKFTMTDDPPNPGSIAAILAWYDAELPKAIERVRALTPEDLATPVDFYGAFNFPLFQYIEFAVKHTVHHRGQLAAALRPMGSKCPQIYGGSADHPMQM